MTILHLGEKTILRCGGRFFVRVKPILRYGGRFFVWVEDHSFGWPKRMAGCDVPPFVLDWQWSGKILVPSG
jgi:hypothetical protein